MKIAILRTSLGSCPASNLAELKSLLAQVEACVDIVLLPGECLSAGSAPPEPRLSAAFVEHCRAFAAERRCWLAGGALKAGESGETLRSTWLIDRAGTIVERWDAPVGAEVRGGVHFPVIATDFGKIGVLSDPDIWIWEASRLLSLKGAELILAPGILNDRNRDQKLSALWGMATLNCVGFAFAAAASDAPRHHGCATLILPHAVVRQEVGDAPMLMCEEIPAEHLATMRDADLSFRNTFWFGLWSRRRHLYRPLVAETKNA